MPLPNVFSPDVTDALLARIEGLDPETAPRWGRMDVAQMLAHCCILYDQIEGRHNGGPWLARLMARLFARKAILGEKPFKTNLPTPKAAQVLDRRVFDQEKARLSALIRGIHGRGREAMEGHPNPIFGPLRASEWSHLLYKHLDHHLRQFGR